MTSPGAPAPQARDESPLAVEASSPVIAPYHPPPPYPPPVSTRQPTVDSRAVVSLVLAIAGLVLGLPLGVPGLVCGPIAYFMGKSAGSRIEASAGALGGRGVAVAAWVLGVVATAAGAVVSLIWLVVLLVVISAPTS